MDTMLQRIIELMGKRHGEAKALADSIGVPANLVSDWKGGRSKSYPKYAPQIAEYYGVSLDWLSGLSEQKEKPATQSDGLTGIGLEVKNVIQALSDDAKRDALNYLKFLLTKQDK